LDSRGEEFVDYTDFEVGIKYKTLERAVEYVLCTPSGTAVTVRTADVLQRFSVTLAEAQTTAQVRM
jgi:hypothetical protein